MKKTKAKNRKVRRQLRVQRMVRPTGKREHRFVLVVKTYGSRRDAEMAVLTSFAGRKPDGCSFSLRGIYGDKEAWMAGARSGMEIAFQLVMRSLENVRTKCCVRSRPNSEVSDRSGSDQ